MALMRIRDGECAKAVSDFSIVIGDVVGSLDEEILDGSVHTSIDICCLNAAINSRAHGS